MARPRRGAKVKLETSDENAETKSTPKTRVQQKTDKSSDIAILAEKTESITEKKTSRGRNKRKEEKIGKSQPGADAKKSECITEDSKHKNDTKVKSEDKRTNKRQKKGKTTTDENHIVVKKAEIKTRKVKETVIKVELSEDIGCSAKTAKTRKTSRGQRKKTEADTIPSDVEPQKLMEQSNKGTAVFAENEFVQCVEQGGRVKRKRGTRTQRKDQKSASNEEATASLSDINLSSSPTNKRNKEKISFSNNVDRNHCPGESDGLVSERSSHVKPTLSNDKSTGRKAKKMIENTDEAFTIDRTTGTMTNGSDDIVEKSLDTEDASDKTVDVVYTGDGTSDNLCRRDTTVDTAHAVTVTTGNICSRDTTVESTYTTDKTTVDIHTTDASTTAVVDCSPKSNAKLSLGPPDDTGSSAGTIANQDVLITKPDPEKGVILLKSTPQQVEKSADSTFTIEDGEDLAADIPNVCDNDRPPYVAEKECGTTLQAQNKDISLKSEPQENKVSDRRQTSDKETSTQPLQYQDSINKELDVRIKHIEEQNTKMSQIMGEKSQQIGVLQEEISFIKAQHVVEKEMMIQLLAKNVEVYENIKFKNDKSCPSEDSEVEVDILQEHCQQQKRTIRTLYQQIDEYNTRSQEMSVKFKKVLIYILTNKTSFLDDVSKQTHINTILNDLERLQKISCDELCSFILEEESDPVEDSNMNPQSQSNLNSENFVGSMNSSCMYINYSGECEIGGPKIQAADTAIDSSKTAAAQNKETKQSLNVADNSVPSSEKDREYNDKVNTGNNKENDMATFNRNIMMCIK